jgi:exosome complex RNA-binding protein Rrp42 (RNase PH superfamily)
LEDSLLVDASPEEEACCAAALIVGVSPNKKITTTSIPGHGSFLADPIVFAKVLLNLNFQSKAHSLFNMQALNLAVDVGVKLNTSLEAAIHRHQTLKPVPRGFLD